jgi:hypothetical protein
MTMLTVLPLMTGSDLLTVLAAMTAIYEGTPWGGGELLPGSADQVAPQVGGLLVVSAKPSKLEGASPPLSELSFAHWAPQYVTDVPWTAF